MEENYAETIEENEEILDEVPRLPQPVYDNEGGIKFFPRIVGGATAKSGQFRGIVSKIVVGCVDYRQMFVIFYFILEKQSKKRRKSDKYSDETELVFLQLCFKVSVQTWKGDHICGGTLFDDFGNNTHVLTAAHCVVNLKKRVLDPRKV